MLRTAAVDAGNSLRRGCAARSPTHDRFPRLPTLSCSPSAASGDAPRVAGAASSAAAAVREKRLLQRGGSRKSTAAAVHSHGGMRLDEFAPLAAVRAGAALPPALAHPLAIWAGTRQLETASIHGGGWCGVATELLGCTATATCFRWRWLAAVIARLRRASGCWRWERSHGARRRLRRTDARARLHLREEKRCRAGRRDAAVPVFGAELAVGTRGAFVAPQLVTAVRLGPYGRIRHASLAPNTTLHNRRLAAPSPLRRAPGAWRPVASVCRRAAGRRGPARPFLAPTCPCLEHLVALL